MKLPYYLEINRSTNGSGESSTRKITINKLEEIIK